MERLKTRGELVNLAKRELARLWHCDPNVFHKEANTILALPDPEGRTRHFFEMATFGKGTVIRADADMAAWSAANLADAPGCRIMDGDLLYQIESKLRAFGRQLAGAHVKYLLDPCCKRIAEDGEESIVIYRRGELEELYAAADRSLFRNALSFREDRDVIAAAAWQDGILMAAAGADDAYMGSKLWQIGVDTLPDFRRKGLGCRLVIRLAQEIMDCGAQPYYTTWSANLASTRLALKTGFFPAWVHYYTADTEPAGGMK